MFVFWFIGVLLLGLLTVLIVSVGRRRAAQRSATVEEPKLGEIREHIDRRIAEGFDSPEDIAQSTAEHFELEGKDRLLSSLVREAMDRQLQAQKDWPSVTDCDRLDGCFAELEKDGIVARQNFTCCQTCGHAEMGDEIESAKKEGAVSGYTFYHQQDTERAAEGGGVYLAYGSLSGEEPRTLEVAQRIAEALSRSGLKVTWDGTVSQRIRVDLDWRRRR